MGKGLIMKLTKEFIQAYKDAYEKDQTAIRQTMFAMVRTKCLTKAEYEKFLDDVA